MNKTDNKLYGKDLVDLVVKSATDKLSEKITTIDLTEKNGSADWFVICEGDNIMHTQAIADEIIDAAEKKHTAPWHVEGKEDGRWVLIDFSDVVVHVMLPEIREFYNLEELWDSNVKEKTKKLSW